LSVDERDLGVRYLVTASPAGAAWSFGDGVSSTYSGRSGFGVAYPQASTVAHVYEAHSQGGYGVRAALRYEVTWQAVVSGRVFGPYPMGSVTIDAVPLRYPVEQAQPELLAI
jgi:hypothetical protein